MLGRSLPPDGDEMKFKYVLYSMLAASLLFVGVMAYLYLVQTPIRNKPATGGTVMASQSPEEIKVVREQARTVSGKGGELVIFYSGDMMGSLDPCG